MNPQDKSKEVIKCSVCNGYGYIHMGEHYECGACRSTGISATDTSNSNRTDMSDVPCTPMKEYYQEQGKRMMEQTHIFSNEATPSTDSNIMQGRPVITTPSKEVEKLAEKNTSIIRRLIAI